MKERNNEELLADYMAQAMIEKDEVGMYGGLARYCVTHTFLIGIVLIWLFGLTAACIGIYQSSQKHDEQLEQLIFKQNGTNSEHTLP
jgi:phosphotransferase system  glucose/maltose/N-acetylglucosamine-specific IIC component